MDAKFCYDEYNAGWFTRWGAEFDYYGNAIQETRRSDTPDKMPIHEMITDISLVGGFLENIAVRKGLHQPFWNEGNGEPEIRDIDNDHLLMPASKWMSKQRANVQWSRTVSPFDIPHILKGLVGEQRYYLRDELLEAIKADDTRGLLGL